MLTSWSEQSTPAELSMKSVLIRPPLSANATRPFWVQPRLPPSPTTRQRRLLAVDADRVVEPVLRLGLGLARGLDVGADAAVPEQVDRRLEDGVHQLVGRQALGLDAQHRARLGRQRDRLGRARPDAAAALISALS